MGPNAQQRLSSAISTLLRLPPLQTLATLTPGDFAMVHNKAEILRRLHEQEALAATLRTEYAVKPEPPRSIGFLP